MSSEDLLGRSSFAHQLANSIIQFDTRDNYAVSLQGKWGCGKTSVLNMTIEEIRRQCSENDANNKVEIVEFNPWDFRDANQLINQFFLTLSNSLKVSSKEENIKVIGNLIEKYSSALEYSEYIPTIGQYLKLLPKLSKEFGKAVKEKAENKLNDVSYRKKEVEKALAELDSRILVIIDDIDRLPNDQIKLIFQLVNSVAGFPNITYLLSYDREIVARALSDVQNCNGEEYLEKIIQLPFDVPPLSSSKLQNILIERLNEIIELPADVEFDNTRWSKVLRSCISPFIGTLRDVHRYYNVLAFTYSPIKDEVDFIDLAGICSLKVFAFPIYEWIRENSFSLVGGNDANGVSMNDIKQHEAEMIESFKEIYPEAPTLMLNAVSSIFPKFSNKVSYISIFETSAELHSDMRIAATTKFDLYYSLSLDNIKISKIDLNRSLCMMDELELREYISSLYDRNIYDAYLQELKYHSKKIPKDRIELFLSILLFKNGRINCSNDNLSALQPIEINIYMIKDLLFEIDDEYSRFDIIKTMLSKSDLFGFEYLLHLLHIIELSHGRIAETPSIYNEKLVNIENLDILEEVFSMRVRHFASTDNLFDLKEFRRVNMLWKYIDKESYNEYLISALQDDMNMVKFLSIHLATWSSGGKAAQFELSDLEYKTFIDNDGIKELIGRVRKNDDLWSLGNEMIQSLISYELLLEDSEGKKIVEISDVEQRFDLWKRSS